MSGWFITGLVYGVSRHPYNMLSTFICYELREVLWGWRKNPTERQS